MYHAYFKSRLLSFFIIFSFWIILKLKLNLKFSRLYRHSQHTLKENEQHWLHKVWKPVHSHHLFRCHTLLKTLLLSNKSNNWYNILNALVSTEFRGGGGNGTKIRDFIITVVIHKPSCGWRLTLKLLDTNSYLCSMWTI